MDLQLFGRVLWRFKLIVLVGFVIAVVLGFLSIAKFGPSGLTYRGSQLYSATTRLGVTQKGFPWGRLFAETAAGSSQGTSSIPVADPDRLNALAVLYAQLATSDPVRSLMRRAGPIKGQILAAALKDDSSNTLLPLIDVTGIETSPAKAVRLANRAAHALESYVEVQQRTNAVPANDRVILQEVTRPKKVHIYQARSKTMPVVVFLGVMFATIGLAFLLENLRPRRVAVIQRDAERATATARLTA